jgi:hypothetical protein
MRVAADIRGVNENVVAAFLRFDEAETSVVIPPDEPAPVHAATCNAWPASGAGVAVDAFGSAKSGLCRRGALPTGPQFCERGAQGRPRVPAYGTSRARFARLQRQSLSHPKEFLDFLPRGTPSEISATEGMRSESESNVKRFIKPENREATGRLPSCPCYGRVAWSSRDRMGNVENVGEFFASHVTQKRPPSGRPLSELSNHFKVVGEVGLEPTKA